MKTFTNTLKLGLIVLTLTAGHSFAAPSKKSGTTLNASSSGSSTYRGRSKVDLLLGAGVNSLYGSWGLNFRVGAEFRIGDRPLLIGAETGLIFGFGGSAIPFLGTATYELSDLSNKTIQARFGVSVGPMIHIGRGYYWWYSRYDDYASVSLMILTRPGAQIRMSDNMALNAELVIGGSLSGMFMLNPQATLVIKL